MKTTIKNRIYLVVMIGMSVSGCFASDGPYNAQGLVPGGYGLPLGIEQLPVDNSASLTPVYTGSHNSQLGVQAWESVLMQQQLMNQQEESRKQQKEWKKKEAEISRWNIYQRRKMRIILKY